MNLPNALTILRIILAPVFLAIFFIYQALSLPPAPVFIILFALYAVMELTDVLDGYIARSRNLVTELGKNLDPFADVLARMTYFLCFTGAAIMPVWILAILIYRELSITFLRAFMYQRGTALPASIWGKIKAVLYSVSAFFGMAYLLLSSFLSLPGWADTVLFIMFLSSAGASLASFITYIPLIAANIRKPK